MKKVGAIVILALLLAGCKGFKQAYGEQFVKSWREGFVESCVEGNDTQEQRDVCTCCADRAIEELTVKQLHDIKYTTDYIKEKILPDCMEGY